MTTQGLSNSLQLESLKRRLQTLPGMGEEILQRFGVTVNNPERAFAIFCEDIELQLYKFNNAAPGEIIKLTSMIAPKWNLDAYVTRDETGNFQIILQNNKYGYAYNILNADPQTWEPEKALRWHLNYFAQKFQTNPPEHLEPYIGTKFNLYNKAIQENANGIARLDVGESMIISASPETGRRPIHIIKTSQSEYKVLLETGNPREPLVQLNNEKKVVWEKVGGSYLDEKALEFLQRTLAAKKNLEQNGLPNALQGLIYKDDLLRMYDYILSHPEVLAKLSSGKEFRLDKKMTSLPRTMNIVCDLNGDMMLMLETKSKLDSGAKDETRVIGKGSFGTVKPAWRIDTPAPEEWANKALHGENVVEADYEAVFSQRMVQSLPEEHAKKLNTTLLGELFTSEGNVKRSQYSKRAIGDLEYVLKNPDLFPLTAEDKERIMKDLMDGMEIMHSQGKVHQDLKLKNVFIYRDEQGGYYAKVADFGLGYDPNSPREKPSLASAGYESPEVLVAHYGADSVQHNYYHFNNAYIKKNSYAYQKFDELNAQTPLDPYSEQALSYRTPHPANDMWALGIIFHQIQNGVDVKPSDESILNAPPLVQGLLKLNREERLNIQQAKALITPPAPSPIVETQPLSRRRGVESGIVIGQRKEVKANAPTLEIPYESMSGFSSGIKEKIEKKNVKQVELSDDFKKKLNQILSNLKPFSSEAILNMDVKQEYAKLREEKVQKLEKKPMGWLKKSAMNKGAVLTGKEKKRDQQVNVLQNLLSDIKTNPRLNDVEKMQAAYLVFSKMAEQIKKEESNPIFKSSLKEFCDNQCKELQKHIPLNAGNLSVDFRSQVEQKIGEKRLINLEKTSKESKKKRN